MEDVIALQKPGKDPTDPRNYQLVSLFCHPYNIFERIILNRITEKIYAKSL